MTIDLRLTRRAADVHPRRVYQSFLVFNGLAAVQCSGWLFGAAYVKWLNFNQQPIDCISNAETVSALKTMEYLEERAKRGDRAKFEAAMAKVADIEPEDYDRL